jgi:hypothetical protein
MLDSGAFGAWTRGTTIDYAAYCDYIRANLPHLWSYVNLDTIPGRLGVPRTRAEIAESARLSYDNQQHMRASGLRPIPVFHQGESFEWLHKMIADGEDYVGISPADDTPRDAQQDWLDACFTLLTDERGYPLVRTHGFGVINFEVLKRYPFYTADGTSWVLSGGYGNIFVPSWTGSAWNYLDSKIVSVTEVRAVPNDFRLLPPEGQEIVRRYCAEELDEDMRLLAHSCGSRWYANARYYKKFAEQLPTVQFQHRTSSLLQDTLARSPPPIEGMRLCPILATKQDAARSRTLNRAEYRDRLISYWELRDDAPDSLKKYVETGGSSAELKRPATNWKSAAYLRFRAQKLIERMRDDDNQPSGTAGQDVNGRASAGQGGLRASDVSVLVHGRGARGVQRAGDHQDVLPDPVGRGSAPAPGRPAQGLPRQRLNLGGRR